MSCEYDGCPIEKFCTPASIGVEDYCGALRAYRKGKADERKKVLDEVIALARAEIDFESQAEQARFVEFIEGLKVKEQTGGGKT